ncbi:MAG TPA: MFS transporter [Ktedonobacterales bacterium]|jgi:DHA3 family tetracycline resistance protein-like MFS transporter
MSATEVTGDRLRFARALRSRPFALLWLGQTISTLGDGAYLTALAWQVLILTGSGAAMGIVLIATSVPRVLFMLLGGVIADRLPRRLVMLWADAGRAIAVGAIAVLSHTNTLQFWQLIALGLLFGLSQAFFLPAYQSIAPQLVEVEALPSANALNGLTREIGTLAGPALGALLVANFSTASAFAFDALTFLVSALCLLAVRVPLKPLLAQEGLETETAKRRGVRGVFADIREGIGYVAASSWLWVTIAIAAFGNALRAPYSVTLPLHVRDFYHSGVGLYGAIFSAFAAGSILATLAVGQLRRIHHRGIVAYSALLVSSLAMMAFALPVPHDLVPVVTLTAGALDGAGLGVFEVIWVTVLQEMVPSEKLGRVSSVDFVGSFLFQPLGLAAIGFLTDAAPTPWIFFVCGALSLLLNASGFLVRGIRELP